MYTVRAISNLGTSLLVLSGTSDGMEQYNYVHRAVDSMYMHECMCKFKLDVHNIITIIMHAH